MQLWVDPRLTYKLVLFVLPIVSAVLEAFAICIPERPARTKSDHDHLYVKNALLNCSVLILLSCKSARAVQSMSSVQTASSLELTSVPSSP